MSQTDNPTNGKPMASLTIAELLRPKADGDRVNAHIVPAVREPAPDYEAMRRLVGTPSKETGD